MSKIIPILPCIKINDQCAFYESLGFTTISKFTAPNAYAVVAYEDIVLHFWGSKKHEPEHNASMIFVEIEDVYQLNEIFATNIKQVTGKVPRSGMPRLSKVRELKEDTRFTLTDPAGNTLYFGKQNKQSIPARTLENEKYANVFAAAYDLLYSHEGPKVATKALENIVKNQHELSESDKEKLEKLQVEIGNYVV